MKEHGILFSAPMVRAIPAKTQTRRVMSPGNSTVDGRRPNRDLWAVLDFSRAVVTKNANPTLSVPRLDDDDRWHRVRPVIEVGDRLWVREQLRGDGQPGGRRKGIMRYGADGEMVLPCCSCLKVLCSCNDRGARMDCIWEWKRPVLSAMFMPRWASRITLEVTDVRAQRLQDISEEDARAEGLACLTKDGSLYKYGLADSDGLPGNDDYGWHWKDWDVSAVKAYMKLWDHINGAGSWAANPYVWAYTFRQVPA